MRRICKRVRTTLWVGAALSVLLVAPAQAKRVPVLKTDIGHWSIFGYNDDDPMCGAVISNGTNSFIFDYIPKDGYALNLMDDTGRWHPIDGHAYVLNATLTGKVPITMKGVGWQNRVAMLLGGDDSALDPFRKGGVLSFETEAQRFEIDLEESDQALSAFRDCVKQIFGNTTP
jgi:hypothetical protein